MAFRATALAGQRSHLTLDFVDEIVESREVNRRFLETSLRAAPTVAVQADTGCFFEQLASFVRSVGEQGVDHPAFDHHPGIRTEARASHQILNVAQAARRTIKQVLAFARAK